MPLLSCLRLHWLSAVTSVTHAAHTHWDLQAKDCVWPMLCSMLLPTGPRAGSKLRPPAHRACHILFGVCFIPVVLPLLCCALLCVQVGGIIPESAAGDLLDEVANLVESPTIIRGSFDLAFLELPE